MPPKKRDSHSWVYAIWGMNAVVVICLLGGGIFYLNSQRASAANDPAETPRAASTQKIPPTIYFLPTLTPNPLSTVTVFETSTPFILDHGQQSNVIGCRTAGVRSTCTPLAAGSANI
jgi:hypothetical protein